MLKFLKGLYEAAMDKSTPTSQKFTMNDVYNEDKLTLLMINATNNVNESPANIHATIEQWRNQITNDTYFVVTAKSRNRDWKMRLAFFDALADELRFY